MLVCLLVGISGGVRYWRDWQFQSLSQESEKPPFTLSELPEVFGDWQVVPGSDEPLPKEVAEIAGASDSVIRTYSNPLTGEKVSVMVLYGLAAQVYPHTPAVCYPSAGFRPLKDSVETVAIVVPDRTEKVPFLREQFAKGEGAGFVVQEVYHSFRNAGLWTPEMAERWKAFRHHPGMFKVQVQRALLATGDDETNARQLIGRVVQEIERRLASQG